MESSTLYELTGKYMQLLDLASDPDTDLGVLRDTMEGLDGEIEDKADGYASVIAKLQSDVEGLKGQISRMSERKRSLEANIERMKEALQASMETTGKRKFKTTLFSFSIAKNPPRVVVDAPESVPEDFLIQQEPKIDTASIKEALKGGAVYNFAHLEQGESLRIR